MESSRIGLQGVKWIDMAQDRNKQLTLVNRATKSAGFIKYGEVLN
jgi:hypothetical protein